MVMGLTTGLWVSAQVRLCDIAFIPATVVRRGDPDAGTVLVKVNRFEDGVTVYTQASTLDDEPAWSRGTGPRRWPKPTPTPTSPARWRAIPTSGCSRSRTAGARTSWMGRSFSWERATPVARS